MEIKLGERKMNRKLGLKFFCSTLAKNLLNMVENCCHPMGSSHQKKSFNPVGLAIGISFGIPYGAAIDSLPLGIAMGLAFGFSLSLALGNEHRDVDEKKEKKAVLFFIFGLIALLLTFLVRHW